MLFVFPLKELPIYSKIPSALITNHELIKQSALTGKQLLMSTGMSTLEEIDDAFSFFRN